MQEEEWREIVEFPGYAVSNEGRVWNQEARTPHMMTPHINQRGIVNVSFNRKGVQYKRSLSLVVATAFVTTARSLSFDTPINLDGDRLNNRASNLMWRPRWYATKYFQQFESARRSINRIIQEMKSEEIFKSSWDAALALGLLDIEIVKSIELRTYAIPTYQRFRVLE